MLTRNISVAVAVLGLIVIVAHAAMVVTLAITLSSWLTGTAIGLILVVAALVHLLLLGRLAADREAASERAERR